MRRFAILGALMAGLVLSGCSGQPGQGDALEQGWSMLSQQDYASARAHYQGMLAEDPNNPYVNLNLGVAYEETGDREMAAKHYQIAVANGEKALIQVVGQDGNVAPRETTVAKLAQANLANLANLGS
jgi:Tfp pilus assembly protein PilF